MTTEQNTQPTKKDFSWTGLAIVVGIIGTGIALAVTGVVPPAIVSVVVRGLGMLAKLI